MTSLPRFSVNNPVLINLMMMTILLGGAYSGLTLVREMFPESRPNEVKISTTYPGATPAEVEKGITLRIEEQIKDVDGVEKVRSTITEGRSVIVAELESGFDAIDQAVNDIEAAVDMVPPEDFPEEALETRVSKFEPRFPVIMISLYGDLSERVLKTLGDRLRDDVLDLPGVTDVSLSGSRKDEISVEVRPAKLAEYNLSFMQVAEAIATANLDLPGGQVRTQGANVAVRTLGEKDRGEELRDIVIRSDQAGRAVHLHDVADIVDGFEDVDVFGRMNALPTVSLTVYKTADQDAVQIAALVRAMAAGKLGQPLEQSRLDRLLAKLSGSNPVQEVYDRARSDPYPSGVGVVTHSDLSRFIEGRLDLLKRNGFWGLILVFLSLLVFLHWRVAFWVMMGLILAITGSLICMQLLGQTLNLITMFGLIIVLGLLVDDAVIVSEHVYSKIEQGAEPRLAAIEGAEEVTAPVVCAILTTIVAFMPLMFIEGRMGDWLGVLPVVVCVALSVSLIEALSILPSHLAHGLRRRAGATGSVEPRGLKSARLEDGSRNELNRTGWVWPWVTRFRGMDEEFLLPRLRAGYERLLRKATACRYVTMAGLTALLMAMGAAVVGGHVPFVFLQTIDSETLIVKLRMGVAAPASATQEALTVIEQAAMEVPELKSLYTLVGLHVSDNDMTPTRQSHLGQAFIELLPAEQRDRTSEKIVQELRAKTANIPGVEKLSYGSMDGGPGGAAVHVEISGKRVKDLQAATADIKTRLETYDGVYDIMDDFEAGRPEVQIELFESARALGLTTESLATQVRSAFYGFEARKVQRGREDVKIMVRYPLQDRKRIYDIESMRIATPSGTLVPFTEVARLREGTGYASIMRTDQRRTITVTADVDENVTKSNQIMDALGADFPDIQRQYPGMQLAFGGQKLETAKSFGSLKISFVIAMMLVYVILAGMFHNYVHPLIVMAVIPFGSIGAIAGHFLMGYPLTILSMIGLVALTGIVVNDSLIVVLFINRRIADGLDVYEAVIEGGKSRLRPILLTSATTVLGIAPLLLERSFQAKFLIPMGISIAAGLIFATVLTLFAIPSLYLIAIDIRRSFSAMGRRLIGGRIPDRGSPIT